MPEDPTALTPAGSVFLLGFVFQSGAADSVPERAAGNV